MLAFVICGFALGTLSTIFALLMGYGVILALLAYIMGGIAGMGLSLAVTLHRRTGDRLIESTN